MSEADKVCCSTLGSVEVHSALARAASDERLTIAQYDRALVDFRDLWAGVLTVEVGGEVVELAETLCSRHRLRAYDAVHLASGIVLSQAAPATTVLATFDLELREATQREGIQTRPDSTHVI